MQTRKVTPFLWFKESAEEAARFYVSLFPNSRISTVTRQDPDGPATTVEFELDGTHAVAFNGGPHFTLNEAFSMSVACDSQEEVDRLWSALAHEGQPLQCGWLKDKYGLCWQIVPSILPRMLTDTDPVRRERVVAAMMKMIKLQIAELQRAYDG